MVFQERLKNDPHMVTIATKEFDISRLPKIDKKPNWRSSKTETAFRYPYLQCLLTTQCVDFNKNITRGRGNERGVKKQDTKQTRLRVTDVGISQSELFLNNFFDAEESEWEK